MAQLPTSRDLGRLPSGRSGRIIANYDTSAEANQYIDLARAQDAKAQSLEGVKSLGRSLQSLDFGGGGGSRGGIGQPSQAERFETNRKFLEFVSAQEQTYEESRQSADPGAFGFQERAQERYLNAAKEFFGTIPDALKPEYDVKLFQAEDQLRSRANKFESAERTRYYGEEVNKGLSVLENNLSTNPDNFDQNYREGVEYINSIPDESVSRIDKATMVTEWRKKAQFASLSGVSPQDRIRLLGGAPNEVDQEPSANRAQSVSRSMSGDIRKTISDAATAYGVDPNALLTIAWLESRGNPNAKNPNSSAGGLFQFIDSTAHAYGLQNKFDPVASADAAARLARDNMLGLERVLGRRPTAGELYLAHQQGLGGATKLLTNPDALAADLVGSEAVRLNGGSPGMTAGEFAMLWMKKAGDTHVPDGGLFNAQFDASKADPRFADLGYVEAQKIIQSSQAEIDSSLTLVDKAKTEQAATTKAQYDQHKGALELGIETGDINSELTILNDPVLTDAHKANLLRSFKQKNEDRILVEKALVALQGGTLRVDPYDTKERGVIDKMYDQITETVPQEELQKTTEEIVEQTGVVPKKALNVIRQGMESTNPDEVVMAAQAAQRLSSIDPAALGRRDGGKAVQEFADDFGHYVNNLNLAPEEAVRRIMDMRDPEKKRDRKALEPLAKEFVKEISEEDVSTVFDAGFFSAAPRAGFTPAQAAGIKAEYIAIAEDAFYKVGGDPELAKNRAAETMKRLYGVTSLTGTPTVIKHPPERYWPALRLSQIGTSAASVVGSSRSLDYATLQLKADLEQLYPDVDMSRVQLVSTPETDRMVKGGELPGYAVIYQDENGLQQTIPGQLWRPDVKAAQRRIAPVEEREAIERESEARRQQQIHRQDIQRQDIIEQRRKEAGETLRGGSLTLPDAPSGEEPAKPFASPDLPSDDPFAGAMP